MSEKKEVEVVLFNLEKEGDLRREYPELADIEEFKNLKVKEVRFCWLVGNRTSPIFDVKPRREKVVKALEIAYGSNYSLQPKLRSIADGEIPDELLLGIKKMSTFNPEYRLKAKLIDQYIFDRLNKLIMLSDHDMAAMEADDKKKYADFVLKVSGELKDMVNRLETAYGIKLKNKKTKKEVLVNLEQVM